MDRNKAKNVHSQIEEAIKKILKDQNLVLSKSSARYDSSSFHLTLQLEDPGIQDRRNALMLECAGVKEGQDFTFRYNNYKVVGSEKGRKFNWIIAERQPDGKRFKFRPDLVPMNK